MVIFDRKRLKHKNEMGGTLYGLSKGWIDAELFEYWFERLFIKICIFVIDEIKSLNSDAAIIITIF